MRTVCACTQKATHSTADAHRWVLSCMGCNPCGSGVVLGTSARVGSGDRERHGLLHQAGVQLRTEREDLVVEVVAGYVQHAAALAALADAHVGAGLGLQHE